MKKNRSKKSPASVPLNLHILLKKYVLCPIFSHGKRVLASLGQKGKFTESA
jgi:hypothetical protein